MSIAVISDVHGNKEAFEAVLKDITSKGISKIYNLGDVVGYGPDPKACVKLAQANTISVKGNHDHYVSNDFIDALINPLAHQSLLWTMSKLNRKEKEYLKNLEHIKKLDNDQLILVHAGLTDSDYFNNYISQGEDAFVNFEKIKDNQIVLVGHTHTPGLWYPGVNQLFSGIKSFEDGKWYDLLEKQRVIVNVGSVGQPRDGNYRACWLELDNTRAQLHRVDYDVAATQERLRKLKIKTVTIHGIPIKPGERLAERLGEGK